MPYQQGVAFTVGRRHIIVAKEHSEVGSQRIGAVEPFVSWLQRWAGRGLGDRDLFGKPLGLDVID
jgi:hypothetical protein